MQWIQKISWLFLTTAACMLTAPAMAQNVTLNSAPALNIPDGNYDGTIASMTCDTINAALPGGEQVTNVTVSMGIDHTWSGDLTAKLISPDASILTLFSRPGYAEPADDGTGCCGSSADLSVGHPITFDDASPNDAEGMGSAIAGGVICRDNGLCDFFPNPGSAAIPPTNFADLAGESASGNWTLCVADSALGDAGSLQTWSISITYGGGGGATHPVPTTNTIALWILSSLMLGGALISRRRRRA